MTSSKVLNSKHPNDKLPTNKHTNTNDKTLLNGNSKDKKNGVVLNGKNLNERPKEKSIFIAYVLWLFGGIFGLHHIYLRNDRHAFVWWCTLGIYVIMNGMNIFLIYKKICFFYRWLFRYRMVIRNFFYSTISS